MFTDEVQQLSVNIQYNWDLTQHIAQGEISHNHTYTTDAVARD